MRRVRVIPVLLIENRKLVKTTQFRFPHYIGDPINALKILNDKQVDEVAILDIGATRNSKTPDFDFIRTLASECFMPLSYGGGISLVEHAVQLFQAGIEKVIIGTAFFDNPKLIREIGEKYGIQSMVVSIDFRSDWLGRKKVYVKNGSVNTNYTPLEYSQMAERSGAGELLLQNIDRENSGSGYDVQLIQKISASINIPVIPLGGASSVYDFLQAIHAGASGVAAGSMFVYKGLHKAVLINYPDQETLMENLYSKI